MKKKIFFVAAVLIAGQVIAQERDSIIFTDLNKVTVIGTRTEKKLADAPKSVSLLSSKDLQQLPYQNVAELLSKLEGIYVNGTFQNPGALQYLYLRGADARQTLIMIDGIKLSDASTPDNSFDLSELSLAEVEQIEIVRGSQGTLYGSSAIGGTINVVTKKGHRQGFSLQAKSQAGNYGHNTLTWNNTLGLGYQGKSGFYANAGYFGSFNHGFNATLDNGSNLYGYKWNEPDNFRKQDLAFKTGVSKKDWDAYIAYRKVKHKNDIDDGAYQDDENRVVNFDRDLYTYGVAKKFNGNLQVKFYGGITTTERKDDDDSSVTGKNPTVYDAATGHSTFTGNYISNEGQLTYDKGRISIVGGAGSTREKMNVQQAFYFRNYNYTSKSDYDTLGIKSSTQFVYARTEIKIPTKGGSLLNLGGGLRYSHNSSFGDFVSFEINPSLKVDANTLLFINYAKGFNAPSLYQQFAPEKEFSSGITRGNNLLKPEESYSLEAGLRTVADNIVSINLSIYHSEVKNYIDYVYLWNPSKPSGNLDFSDYRGDTYLNMGKLISTGFEIGTKIAFSRKVEFGINGSINVGKLQYEPSEINNSKTQGNQVQIFNNGVFLTEKTEQKELNRRPMTAINWNIAYMPTDKWRIMFDMRSVSSRPDVYYNYALGPFGALSRKQIKSFMIANLGTSFIVCRHMTAGMQLTNLFDQKYMEIDGFRTKGRGIWATVGVEF